MTTAIVRQIIDTVVRLVADRRVDAAQAAAALRPVADPSLPPASLADLAGLVDRADDPALDPIRALTREALMSRVRLGYDLRRSGKAITEDLRNDLRDLPLDAPLDWVRREASTAALGKALSTLDDLRFVVARKDAAPRLAQGIEAAFFDQTRAVAEGSPVWGALRPLDLIRRAEEACAAESPQREALERLRRAREADEAEQRARAARALQDGATFPPAGVEDRIFLDAAADAFEGAGTDEDRRRLLDLVACWPTDQAALVLPRLDGPAWVRDRLARIIALRFGEPFSPDWAMWKGDIEAHNRQMGDALLGLANPLQKRPGALLLVWYCAREHVDPAVVNVLIGLESGTPPAVDPDEFVLRWSGLLTTQEANAIAHPSPPPLPESARIPPPMPAAESSRVPSSPPVRAPEPTMP